MKKILISFLIVTAFYSAFSQEPDRAIAKIQYSFSHIRDTSNPEKPHQENMMLIIGKNASRYLSYDAILEKEKREKEVKGKMANSTDANMNIKLRPMKSVTRDEYYFFMREDKLFVVKRLVQLYLLEEPKYKLNWTITNDTMSIEGIHCQKATTHFKGRNWIAWYATELPFQSGPWKLNGLPGLIIDAHDDKNEVKFEFGGLEMIKDESSQKSEKNEMPEGLKGIQQESFQDKKIKLPENAIKTNRKEFERLKEAKERDPQGFLNAQFAGTGITVKINKGSASKKEKPSPTKINNPIELPEK